MRKLVAFDPETWQTLDLLARDAMKSFQEVADEAFRDLLKKHGRPDTLRGALRRSAEADAEADGTGREPGRRPRRPRRVAHAETTT